jgi:type II secretory pathway pseudopilin PulG
MTRQTRAAVLAVLAAFGMTALAAAQKPDKEEKAKAEVLKTITDATAEFDKDKKVLTVVATGQVPTGGWTGARLTRKDTKPKDGVYEFELTAVRPTGIVTQVISKVKASYSWVNPPADVKEVRILGVGEGVKTVKVTK